MNIEFEISDDACFLGLINTERYISFVDENWEFDQIKNNEYQRSRELEDYERTRRGEPLRSSPEALVSTPCTPGIHLGRGYNAGYIPPESLSQTQRNIRMSIPTHVRTEHYRTHTPSPSPTSPSGHQGGAGNPGGNGHNDGRPSSFMRDGCIARNGGGPSDDPQYIETGGIGTNGINRTKELMMDTTTENGTGRTAGVDHIPREEGPTPIGFKKW